ncbi:TetR/AcrR family transcriptional regulator [Streptomyces sp. NPDC048442]|uniref:TetR/AcrR family transcriptional regulator n=1 Tax=Streptomyces sp. NPDC048442 TaxID=3154823 RepID=UPI0034305036
MSTMRGARERARTEVTAAIKEEARRQLAAEGAAKLSLRAVARELGMASSALYRYFPSRDDLLTALITDAYDAAGAAAEAALAVAPDDTDHPARWLAVCVAVRRWALDHPHEYALLYGSPVPGYSAPQTTVEPAARVALALMSVARDAHRSRGLALVRIPAELRPEAERLAADIAPDLPPEAAVAFAAVWAQLFGLISFEVFGHYHRVVEDRDAFFAHAAGELARTAGVLPQA